MRTSPNQPLLKRARLWIDIRRGRQRIQRIAAQIENNAPTQPSQKPVIFFNASTRLTGMSQNAAFSLLTAWSLRLAGVPVVHFVCHRGMAPCVLGTNRQDHSQPPPCQACIAQSERLYSGADIYEFNCHAEPKLASTVENLSIDELSGFEYQLEGFEESLPLGSLVLPSLRWALRRHTLIDDQPTRYLLRQYILSTFNVAREFTKLIREIEPQSAVTFNGIMYPEAAARWVAQQLGIRSIAHEVGFQPFSVFFTDGEPTAYPIHIPEEFELTSAQNAQLDAYLSKRFQGKFTMAGIEFWPEIRGLNEEFLQKAGRFHQVVSVFTNVIYDTSQIHANVHFLHMFAWLDQLLGIIQSRPETLFVIRAHPDEMRPGTAKQSKESVHDWVVTNQVKALPNVVFIDSLEYISSYELIQRSKFIMVYNSSIGLEATLLGKPALCGGKARYTQYPTVFFPTSSEDHRRKALEFLDAEQIQIPPQYLRNARRFLYYQLYRASIPLERYLQSLPRMGFVQLRRFSWEDLLPKNSPSLRVLHRGILMNEPFLLTENGTGISA